MPTTYTPLWRLAVMTPGDPLVKNSWGAVQDLTMPLMEQGAVGQVSVPIGGLITYSLTTANNATDQARYLAQSYTGALLGNCTVTIPNALRFGWARNATTGGFNVILSAGGATATIPPDGLLYFWFCDGSTNVAVISVGFNALNLAGLLSPAAGIGILGQSAAVQAGSVGEIKSVNWGGFGIPDSSPTQLASLVLGRGNWLCTTGGISLVAPLGFEINSALAAISLATASLSGSIAAVQATSITNGTMILSPAPLLVADNGTSQTVYVNGQASRTGGANPTVNPGTLTAVRLF